MLIKFGSRDQFGLLLLYKLPCSIATFLPELIDSIWGLIVEFPRLIALGDFNISEVTQELMASRTYRT